MLARALSRALARANVHYGWVVVAAAFMVSISMTGVMGLPGALMLPIEREFGWSASAVSNVLALRILLYGLIAPFAAALIERHGVRRMALIAVGLVAFALIAALFMTSYWQMMLLFGVVIGVGTGITALAMSAIIATRWFTASRGLVLGILTASYATGSLVFLPVAAYLESRWGWRAALLPSVGGLAIGGSLLGLLMVERPGDLGLNPYGETGPLAPPPASRPALSSAFKVLGEVGDNPVFWILAGEFFVCGLSTNGLVQTHFISLCADYGVAAVTAASMLALIGVSDFFGTLGSGWLSDRFDNRALLFAYYGLRGLSLLFLPYSDFSVYQLSIFSVIYGLDWVATVPPTVKLAAESFGRERAGVAFGWIFAAHMVGAAFAAALGGFSRSVWLTYMPAFYIGGAACLIAALSALWINRRPPAGRPQPAQ